MVLQEPTQTSLAGSETHQLHSDHNKNPLAHSLTPADQTDSLVASNFKHVPASNCWTATSYGVDS